MCYTAKNHYHKHVYESVYNYFNNLPSYRLNIRSNLVKIVRKFASIANESYDGIFEFLKKPYLVPNDKTSLLSNIIDNYISENELEKIYNYQFCDIYYWEYRMGIWMNGAVLLKDDVNFDTYMLFNCRKILEYGLSMPRYFKDINLIVYKTIENLWPEIIDPIPNTNYKLIDYHNFEDKHKVPIKYNCDIQSNLPNFDIYTRIGRYNATLGFWKNLVKKNDYIELLLDFSVKNEGCYWLQINVCVNWEECSAKETSTNAIYEIVLCNELVYLCSLNQFMSKENQINILKYFDNKGDYKIKLKLFAKKDLRSENTSAGLIHIEGIRLSQSFNCKNSKETKVISTRDMFMNMDTIT